MMYVFYFVRNQTAQGFLEMVVKFGNFLIQKVSHTVSYFNKETENIKMNDNVQMWHWVGRTGSWWQEKFPCTWIY